MAGLAEMVGDVVGSDSTWADKAWQDPMDYEIPRLMAWALQAADRLFGCGRVVPRTTHETEGSPDDTPRTVTTAKSIVTLRTVTPIVSNFQSQRARLAHMENVVRRVTTALEALLVAFGAGVLHLITGVCVGLVAVADFHTGVVFAILVAVRHFPEGLLLSGDALLLSETPWAGWDRPSRCQGFFTTALVGLCDCLGACIALAITVAHGVLPSEMLAAIYFVNGGISVQLALRKFLRAAVSFNPEKEIPTIAMIAGMLISGAALCACKDALDWAHHDWALH
jgi:zinc transporter ZupT